MSLMSTVYCQLSASQTWSVAHNREHTIRYYETGSLIWQVFAPSCTEVVPTAKHCLSCGRLAFIFSDSTRMSECTQPVFFFFTGTTETGSWIYMYWEPVDLKTCQNQHHHFWSPGTNPERLYTATNISLHFLIVLHNLEWGKGSACVCCCRFVLFFTRKMQLTEMSWVLIFNAKSAVKDISRQNTTIKSEVKAQSTVHATRQFMVVEHCAGKKR